MWLRVGREVWAWGPRCKHLQLRQDVLLRAGHIKAESSNESPGGCLASCLDSHPPASGGQDIPTSITRKVPRTSPTPADVSCLCCLDPTGQTNETWSSRSESHRNIGASQSPLLQVPDVPRGPVRRRLAGGHPAAAPQLLRDCKAEEDPASEQQHPVCH